MNLSASLAFISISDGPPVALWMVHGIIDRINITCLVVGQALPHWVPCSSVVGKQTRTEVGQYIAGSKLIRVQCVGLGRAAAPSKGSFHLAASSQNCEMPFDPALQSSS